MTPPRSQCRSCGAPIYWARTASGRTMPVDAEPVASGTILLTLTRSTGALTCEMVSAGAEVASGRHRYASHYATCPNASSHRRSR